MACRTSRARKLAGKQQIQLERCLVVRAATLKRKAALLRSPLLVTLTNVDIHQYVCPRDA